jgi:voltage-gated sodium channel
VLALILGNAVLMGLETSPTLLAAHGPLLAAVHALVQALFVLEIGLRLLACWPRPASFFRDGWNVFDFAVVAVSLLPQSGPPATLARVARLLRAARLASALPELRRIVATMLRSIPSLGHVLALLALLLYVYGVLGVQLFREADPQHWGTLARAVLTLFQVLTLEGWVELMATASRAQPAAWLFFASYIVLAVFVVVNLFIAVVINNLESARREVPEPAPRDELTRRLAELRANLDALAEQLGRRPAPGA